MILFNVVYSVKEGKRDEFYNKICAKGIVDSSRQEAGNLKYNYYLPMNEKNDILLIEIWNTLEEQATHILTTHYKELQKIKQEYVTNIRIEKFNIVSID